MNKVINFPPTDTFTPELALQSSLRFAEDDALTDVMIVGYDRDGDLFVRSSAMSRMDALWMMEKLKAYILED